MCNRNPVSAALSAFWFVIACAGCGFGPHALRVNQTRYNEAIQGATNEQLLLNLVRLRYRDVPLFLQIPSVSTQYEIRQATRFDTTLNENVGPEPLNPDVWNLGATFEFSERPTVTLIPLQENEFVKRMFAKYDPDTIALLHGSGWAVDRVLMLTVSRINGLGNAVTAASPTPEEAPEFAEFARFCKLLRALQKRGEYSLEPFPRDVDVSDVFTYGEVPPGELLSLAEKGYKLRRSGEGYVLRSTRKDWRLHLTEAGRTSPEWGEACKLLGLDPSLKEYEVLLGTASAYNEEAAGTRSRLIITPRSLLGTLFFLSHAVDVPRDDLSSGLATVTRDAEGREIDWGDVTMQLLRIHSASQLPAHAAVAVRYRGKWFYIDDRDRNTKSTFMLLNYMFALQAGEYESTAPILTLPVGR